MNKPLRPVSPPEAAYLNDPAYHALVDHLEAMLHRALLTPAEVREASMLACIHYEQRNIRYMRMDGSPIFAEAVSAAEDRLAELRRWIDAHRLPGDG